MGALNHHHHQHFFTGFQSGPGIHCTGDVYKGSNLCIAMLPTATKRQHHFGSPQRRHSRSLICSVSDFDWSLLATPTNYVCAHGSECSFYNIQ